jgi:hypothetical protein
MLHKLERGGAQAETTSADPDANVYGQLRAKLARLALAQAAEAHAADAQESADPAKPDPKKDENS